jgi:hypothetical protein
MQYALSLGIHKKKLCKKEKEISLKNYNLNYLLESDLLIRVSFVLQ